MNKIVITGGAGFIGSHVAEKMVEEYPDAEIHILDKMTYAADFENISHLLKRGQRYLCVGDICDFEFCLRVTKGADLILHLAAESHVDNSFGNSFRFTQSNTLGTHTLLEATRVNEVPRFIHVSTDEVYGEIRSGFHKESDILNPTNPYSASKAAADMIVNSYIRSFKLPVVSVRANNIYGIRQYPEKLIPRFTLLGLTGQRFTVHGDGSHSRRFLAAEDFAEAMALLVHKGQIGEIYNIGSDSEYTTLQIVDMISERLGIRGSTMTEFVGDRPFNDCRYAIDCSKLQALGWKQSRPLERHLLEVIEWYKHNRRRYEHIFDMTSVPESFAARPGKREAIEV
jgi:dTDP-glucose 4,6-dehydratase